jgi:hypothetical protein
VDNQAFGSDKGKCLAKDQSDIILLMIFWLISLVLELLAIIHLVLGIANRLGIM